MSEPRKARHLIQLLEGIEKNWNRFTPKPFEKSNLTYKTNKAGDQETTYADTGTKYQRSDPNFFKTSQLDTNYDGWTTKGKSKKSKEEAKAHQQELQRLAKDYGVESPRAFTANLRPETQSVDTFNNSPTTTGSQPRKQTGRHSAGTYTGGSPYHSTIELKRLGGKPFSDEDMAHELAHHNSMNFGAVDAEGNMRIISDHDGSKMGITGFGVSKGNTNDPDQRSPADKYKDMQIKHFGSTGIDRDSLRKEIYDQVVNNPENKQRPELKHALGTAVSHILSDARAMHHGTTGWGANTEYGLAPEEMWARSMAEFSRLKRLPKDQRFGRKDVITPETYKKVQELMDTIRVKYKHTMTKRQTQQGPRTA